MTAEAPTPEVVAAWMQSHVCTPRDGIPAWFAARFTGAAERGGENNSSQRTAKYGIIRTS